MAKEFRLQDPGEGIHEAEIKDVLVSQGDSVEEGQTVLVIETDKAAVEVPSPYSGTIQDLPVSAGDHVRVGDLLMTIGEGGEEGEAEQEEEEAAGEEPEPEEKAEPEAEEPEEKAEREEKAETEAEEKAEPEAEEKAEAEEPEPEPEAEEQEKREAEPERQPEPKREKHGEGEPQPVTGIGDEGATERGPKPPAEPGARGKEPSRGDGPVPATPATRRLARELGVDLEAVSPSGPEGRVLKRDVQEAAEGKAPPERKARRREERPEPAREAAGLPDFGQWGPVEREKVQSIRLATARHMARAWAEIPHVTHQDSADISELEKFRQRHEARIAEDGGKLTLTVLAVKAVAAALAEFPRFNASFDAAAEELVLKQYCHIGVALDTPRGLMVPVLRDVDRKSLSAIALELSETGRRLREEAPSPDELQGGCFTITNVGALGGTSFTPIINHPEVAILGMATARLEQVITGTPESALTQVRLMLPLCLAFDHRVNDGADAARFTRRLIELLGDPEQLALAM